MDYLYTLESWQGTESLITQKIQSRIRRELLLWERETHFFEVQRPRLIKLFEKRFRGIQTHLSSVETMISRNDSHRVSLDTSVLHQQYSDNEHDGTANGFPGTFLFTGVHLHWTRKLALGLVAPLLIPLAVAAALLGLPILGGLAARDLVVERISEVKVREYRMNKINYLISRTTDYVKTFAKSSALEDHVYGELKAAFRCIGQLRDEVPRQIEADRSQILGLRDDDRQTTDLERFYRPLVEVFEHSRLLLAVYRLSYLRRDRLDVDFTELSVLHGAPVICDSLTGTVTAASWTRRQELAGCRTHIVSSSVIEDQANSRDRVPCASAVALKQLVRRLDTRNVEDYMLEEEAYRFQACPYIAQLLATSKHFGIMYHILEPLQCSLRQHLASSDPVVESSYPALWQLLLQLLRGLDYLHDRGWVHFDLSLDSIGVDMVGKIKLTNISCRQLVSVTSDLAPPTAMTSLLRYTHLPPEVLAKPPAAYTPAGEMFSVGIAMYEMWTRERAYWRHLASQSEPVIDSIDKLVEFMQTVRPTAKWITKSSDDRNIASGSRIEKVWSDWMQRCWREEERIRCKALLQLVEAEGGAIKNDETMLPMNEQHYLNGE